MDIYREVILDHYKNPRNFGHLKKPDNSIREGNVTCGDTVVMEVHVTKKGKSAVLKDIRFSGEGCAISQASASLLTEHVKGKDVAYIMRLSVKDVYKIIGTALTPSRTKCAVLPLEVLQKAVSGFVS